MELWVSRRGFALGFVALEKSLYYRIVVVFSLLDSLGKWEKGVLEP